MREHEGEPVPGLPEHLPAGETILWQGRPDWRLLARQAFHLRAVVVYFGLLAIWRVAATLHDGGTPADIAVQLAVLALLAAASIGLFLFIGWLIARSTLYTLTNRRVVMRVGVALSLTLNLPFSAITSAAMRPLPGGRGDIPIRLRARHRVGYAVLWPHVRPWRLAEPEPMLRAIPDAERVAHLFTEAFAASTGDRVTLEPAKPTTSAGERMPALARASG